MQALPTAEGVECRLSGDSIPNARHKMHAIQKLWQDESGLVLSAEVVTIGTLGVLGAVVGLNAASTAVDQELKEFAGAIRSLDQSYGYVGHQSCRAWSAGSCYRQQDVQKSLSDLCADGATDIREIEKHVQAQNSILLPAAPHPHVDGQEAVPVTPNRIPVPELKRDGDRKGPSEADRKDGRKPDRKERREDD